MHEDNAISRKKYHDQPRQKLAEDRISTGLGSLLECGLIWLVESLEAILSIGVVITSASEKLVGKRGFHFAVIEFSVSVVGFFGYRYCTVKCTEVCGKFLRPSWLVMLAAGVPSVALHVAQRP